MKNKFIAAALIILASSSAQGMSAIEEMHYKCEDRAKIAYNAYMIRQHEDNASKAIGDAISAGNWMLREFLISFYQIEKSHPRNVKELSEHVRNYTYSTCMESHR